MTPDIYAWATRRGVSLEALHELQAIMGMHGGGHMPVEATGISEAATKSVVLLEGTRKGVWLTRNNVGVLQDARGVPVRYGLANESKQVNSAIKSGDLIGWRSVLVTPAHVGTRIAQFVSRECKRPGWHYKGDAHEQAQLAWAMLVISAGGDAAFCTGEGSL